MITLNVEIDLYSIDELKKLFPLGYKKALNLHEDFMLKFDEENGYMDSIEESDVIDNIKANGYLFYSNGEMTNITNVEGLEKLTFYNVIYEINK